MTYFPVNNNVGSVTLLHLSFTTRVGLAFAANNMLAASGMSGLLMGPERNKAALSKHVSAYPALLEDLVCAREGYSVSPVGGNRSRTFKPDLCTSVPREACFLLPRLPSARICRLLLIACRAH